MELPTAPEKSNKFRQLDTFDALTEAYDHAAFGPDAAAPSRDLTKSDGFENHLRDINEDGFPDLISHYRIESTDIEADDDEVCITGEILGSTPLRDATLFEQLHQDGERTFGVGTLSPKPRDKQFAATSANSKRPKSPRLLALHFGSGGSLRPSLHPAAEAARGGGDWGAGTIKMDRGLSGDWEQ